MSQILKIDEQKKVKVDSSFFDPKEEEVIEPGP